MRKLPVLAAAAVLALPGMAAPHEAYATLLETDARTFPVTASHRVRIEFPIGELHVIPTSESRVRFDLRVRCKGRSSERCAEMADQLVLESDDTAGTLHLRLENYPRWMRKGFTVMGELHVPRALALRVEMGVGQLEIEGLEGDLDVDLGVGQAEIRTLRTRAREVSVTTGIGDANISGADSATERARFLGSRVLWSRGQGRADVRVNVGVGEGTVRLE